MRCSRLWKLWRTSCARSVPPPTTTRSSFPRIHESGDRFVVSLPCSRSPLRLEQSYGYTNTGRRKSVVKIPRTDKVRTLAGNLHQGFTERTRSVGGHRLRDCRATAIGGKGSVRQGSRSGAPDAACIRQASHGRGPGRAGRLIRDSTLKSQFPSVRLAWRAAGGSSPDRALRIVPGVASVEHE